MVSTSAPIDNPSLRHVEVDTTRTSPPAENTRAADTFNVVVSIPENIEIKMVDASALGDYEIWIFIASIFSNAVVGFLVAFIQASDAQLPVATYIGWTTAVFITVFVVSVLVAIYKRSTLRKKGKKIRLKTAGAEAV